MSEIVLVGGGVRSGKSAFALKLARALGPRRAFVATAEPGDGEMVDRIQRHRQERGASFRTIEEPRDLAGALARLREEASTDVVLIDCLTLWLSNLLLADLSQAEIGARVEEVATALRTAPFHSVIVTNEVGLGIVPESALGRTFRDVAGRAHQALAARADRLFFAVLGTILRLRPGPVTLISPSGDQE